mgnify:CR=1 FL=1
MRKVAIGFGIFFFLLGITATVFTIITGGVDLWPHLGRDMESPLMEFTDLVLTILIILTPFFISFLLFFRRKK